MRYGKHGCYVGVGRIYHFVTGRHDAHLNIAAQYEPQGIKSVAHPHGMSHSAISRQFRFKPLNLIAADVTPAVDDTGTRLLQLRSITLIDPSKIEKRISQSTVHHRNPLNLKYSS